MIMFQIMSRVEMFLGKTLFHHEYRVKSGNRIEITKRKQCYASLQLSDVSLLFVVNTFVKPGSICFRQIYQNETL